VEQDERAEGGGWKLKKKRHEGEQKTWKKR